MKLIRNVNESDMELSKSYLEREGDERVLTRAFMAEQKTPFGELFIPEGIEELERGAFEGKFYHTYHFPQSLTRIGENLFEIYGYNTIYTVKIIYNGSSEAFIKLAEDRKEEKYESDGYDQYPYYSGGSRWVTHYYSFDARVSSIEVECAEDGVTLLYGTMRNREEGEPPKVKET